MSATPAQTKAAAPAQVATAAAPTQTKAAAAKRATHNTQHGRNITRKKLVVVLAILAVLLVAGTAFAATMVYSQNSTSQTQEQETSTQQSETLSVTDQAAQEESVTEPVAEQNYGIETISVEVSAPSDPYHSSGERTSDTWTYDQITVTQASDVVDGINAKVRSAFEASVQRTESIPSTSTEYEAWSSTDAAYGNTCLTRNIQITYLSDTIVCFTDSQYRTLFGAHGWAECYGTAYDLTTGELVDMPSLFGITEDQQAAAVNNAVMIALTANPSSASPSEFEAYLSTPDATGTSDGTYLEGATQFYLTDVGLIYPTAAYELGTYADGYRRIVVAAFNDSSLVGTDINASS